MARLVVGIEQVNSVNQPKNQTGAPAIVTRRQAPHQRPCSLQQATTQNPTPSIAAGDMKLISMGIHLKTMRILDHRICHRFRLLRRESEPLDQFWSALKRY